MTRLRIGLLILAVTFFTALGVSGNWGIALCVLCVVLVLLPCTYDPAIIWKDKRKD